VAVNVLTCDLDAAEKVARITVLLVIEDIYVLSHSSFHC
jgi:hypothetical protein